jgi:hypothetical protein
MFRRLRKLVCLAVVVAVMSVLCAAQQTHESRSSLILRGVLFTGDNHSAQVDGKWFTEGDSIQSDGERIQIQRITLNHIEIVRDGTERLIRLGESLHAGKAVTPTTRPTK